MTNPCLSRQIPHSKFTPEEVLGVLLNEVGGGLSSDELGMPEDVLQERDVGLDSADLRGKDMGDSSKCATTTRRATRSKVWLMA